MPFFLWSDVCPLVWMQTVLFLSVPKIVCKHQSVWPFPPRAPEPTWKEPLWQPICCLVCTEVWGSDNSPLGKRKVRDLRALEITQPMYRVINHWPCVRPQQGTSHLLPITQIPPSVVLRFSHHSAPCSSNFLNFYSSLQLQIPGGWTNFYPLSLCTSPWIL